MAGPAKKPTRPPANGTKRKPKPRKPTPPPKQWTETTWIACGLLILGAMTAAPYIVWVVRHIQIVVPDNPTPDKPNPDKPKPPVPQKTFDASVAKLSGWMQVVASDKPASEATQYARGLAAVAADCRAGSVVSLADIDDALRAKVEASMGQVAWLDWSLFTLELFREMQALRSAGQIGATVAEHAEFLDAMAAGLAKLGA